MILICFCPQNLYYLVCIFFYFMVNTRFFFQQKTLQTWVLKASCTCVACVYIRWIGMITKVNFLTWKIFDSFVNKPSLYKAIYSHLQLVFLYSWVNWGQFLLTFVTSFARQFIFLLFPLFYLIFLDCRYLFEFRL